MLCRPPLRSLLAAGMIPLLAAASCDGGGAGDVTTPRPAGVSISGVWVGTYTWSCSGGGSAEISFTVEESQDNAQHRGTASYRGGSAALAAKRYSDPEYMPQGDVAPLQQTASYGEVIQFEVQAAPGSFVFNIFTGTMTDGTIRGTTLNGDSEVQGDGCSADQGPAGSFEVRRR